MEKSISTFLRRYQNSDDKAREVFKFFINKLQEAGFVI